MKAIYSILILLTISSLMFADYILPSPAPKLRCDKAIELAQSKLLELGGTSDSYINTIHLIGMDDKTLWVIWFASPTNGYTILTVQMNGHVRKATQAEIDRARR